MRTIWCCIFLFISLSRIFSQERKWLVEGQDSAFPVYTTIDTNNLKNIAREGKLNFYTDTKNIQVAISLYDCETDKAVELKKHIKSYLQKDDPWAFYLYASLMHLLIETPKKNEKNIAAAKLILNLYEKAARMNLAKAEFDIYEIYRYGDLYSKKNFKKALQYLERAIQHGDNKMKSKCYENLAFIFHPDQSEYFFDALVKKSEDSTIFYLQKSIQLNSHNYSAIFKLGDLYADKGKYMDAFNTYMLSKSSGILTKAAQWLIEGKYIPRDINRGLQLIYAIAEEERKKYNEYHEDYEYTNCNAILLLNDYYNNNTISKEQLSPFGFEEIRNQHPPATIGVFMDWLAPGQDSAYPVHTIIDSNELKKYANIMDFGCEFMHVNNYGKLDSFLTFRDFLQPYVEKEDPYALYLYGRTFPSNHYNWTNPDTQETIAGYYEKASRQNLAMADYAQKALFETSLIRGYLDSSQVDCVKFLKKSLQHGDNYIKSLACWEMVDFFSSNFLPPYFEENDDSCIYYLQMAVKYNPKNNHAIKYLGYLYEKNKMYQQAFDTYLMSSDQDDILKMTYWLVEGKKIKKDIERALSIIYPYAKDAKEKYSKDHYDNYLHNINPVYLLNNLYVTKKISRHQIGEFLIPNYKPKKLKLD